ALSIGEQRSLCLEIVHTDRELTRAASQLVALEVNHDTMTELEEDGRQPCCLIRRSVEQRLDRAGQTRAHPEDAEPRAIHEHEARPTLAELSPQFPRSEVALPHVDVVQKNDPALAHLRKPTFEVVANGLVGVIAVDVQQVDRAVAKVPEGLVEGTLHETRERP